MLHQVGVSFDLYYDARKHKIKIFRIVIQDSVFGIVTALGVRKTEESCLDSLQGQDLFHFCKVSWPILGPTKPPVQQVVRFTSGCYTNVDMKLILFLQLVLMFRRN